MQFSGEEQFAHHPNELWTRLVDMDFMATMLPGLEQVETSEPRLLICRIRPGFSAVVSMVKLRLEILNQMPPESVQMQILGKAIGSTVVIETTIHLAAIENGTNISWRGEITKTTGLVNIVSASRMEEIAEELIGQIYTNVRTELDETDRETPESGYGDRTELSDQPK